MGGMKSLSLKCLVVLALLLLHSTPRCDGQSLTLRDVSNRYSDSRTDLRMTADKDVGRDAYELAVSKGYQAERHEVTTKDGYILEMIRIVGSPENANEKNPLCPDRAQKPVVLLQHGLIDSAATWVMNMPEQSLGFVLADLGFDVWLGNNRGTSYSLKHTELKEGIDGWEKEFWDFSWDEMAQYDLPAEINHILDTSGASDLSYIGHSQGTTQAFAAFSLPEFSDMAEKVRVHIALAPVAFVGNTESILFQAAGHLDVIGNLAQIPDVNVFGNNFLGAGAGSDFIKSLVPSLCSVFLGNCDTEESAGTEAHESLFNTGMMGSLFGLPDMKHLNQSRIPVYLAHIPEGTSVKNLIHWSQAVRSNAFREFDDGQEGGPADYDLLNYKVPTVLVSGRKDPIANRKDIQKLVRWLAQNPGVLVRTKELESYDHNDFTISIDGDRVFFPFVLDYLQDYACPASTPGNRMQISSGSALGAKAASSQGPPPTSPREEKRPSPPDSSWGFLLDVLSSPVVDFTWDYFVEDLVGEASASSVKAETDSLLSFLAENIQNL